MNLTESWQALSDCIAPEASESVGDGDDSWYALFGNRPRSLLVPTRNRRARHTGLKFFLPETLRGLYARLRLYAHAALGAQAQLPVLTLPPASATELCNQLALTDAPQLAFMLGTPGPYQKASILVMTVRGEPQAIVKVALRMRANPMVSAETHWLQILNQSAALNGRLPNLLGAGVTRNGYRYVAQSILRGRPGTRAFTAEHSDFLQRLAAIDCTVQTFAHAAIHDTLRHNFSKLSPALPARLRTLLEAALEECLRRLAAWRGPFVISHGDFAAWNIRTDDNAIRVFDWEYAAKNMPPLFDLMHFHLIGPASSGREIGDRDMQHALAPARAYALLAYPEFEWDNGVIAAQGLAYLLHTLFFYGVSRGELVESHSVVRAYCKLVERREQWLQ